MDTEEENEPVSELLGKTLYELGLITASELKLQQFMDLAEFKELEMN